MISLIAALDSNYLIGDQNKLPWHYPADLVFFKKKSFHKNVLMGYNTYLSLKKYYKNKPFPFRKIYVASTSFFKLDYIYVVTDLISFLTQYRDTLEEIMVIGGSQIYHQSLPYAKVMYLTHVLRRYQGDSFFPYFCYHKYIIQEKKILDELIFVTYINKEILFQGN